jgi:hypothetical protein
MRDPDRPASALILLRTSDSAHDVIAAREIRICCSCLLICARYERRCYFDQ